MKTYPSLEELASLHSRPKGAACATGKAPYTTGKASNTTETHLCHVNNDLGDLERD